MRRLPGEARNSASMHTLASRRRGWHLDELLMHDDRDAGIVLIVAVDPSRWVSSVNTALILSARALLWSYVLSDEANSRNVREIE